MDSTTRSLSETLLGIPNKLASLGGQPARREGLRNLTKRKSRGVDLELEWEYSMGDESLAGGSPRSSCLEAEDGDLGEEEHRRLRRRNNNRNSAKRVKYKRDADMKDVCDKVLSLWMRTCL